MKAGLSAGETFMTGADHGRIDVKAKIPPARESFVRRKIVEKRAIAASDVGNHRRCGKIPPTMARCRLIAARRAANRDVWLFAEFQNTPCGLGP